MCVCVCVCVCGKLFLVDSKLNNIQELYYKQLLPIGLFVLSSMYVYIRSTKTARPGRLCVWYGMYYTTTIINNFTIWTRKNCSIKCLFLPTFTYTYTLCCVWYKRTYGSTYIDIYIGSLNFITTVRVRLYDHYEAPGGSKPSLLTKTWLFKGQRDTKDLLMMLLLIQCYDN